jgi:TolC family type I secretion outer membrane protein
MYCSRKFLLLFLLLFSNFSKAEELSDVLRDAYNYFPDIKKSKQELENAKRDLQISKTDFLPSLEFSSSQGKNVSRSFPDTSNRGDTSLSPTTFDIDLTQPLSYAKMVTLKQSRNKLKIAQLKDKSVTQSVLLRASKAYYTVLKNYFLLDVSKKNEENLIKKLDATEKRFEFRDVTKTDVFQAKARLAEATSKRIEAENNLDISISDFKTVVGREPKINWFNSDEGTITGANPKDWSKFGDIPKIPLSLQNSLDIGLKNNPDFIQLKYVYENSKFDIRKSRLNFAPEFSVTGSVGKSLKSSRTLERKDSYEVTASVSLPIFNKGHNFYNLEKSKNSAISSFKTLESKKLDLIFQIQSTWKKIESTKSSIGSLELSVESNIMAVEGVTKEAGVGTRTTLNILDAEKELTQSESNLVNAQFQLIISSFELLNQCGLLNFEYLDQ